MVRRRAIRSFYPQPQPSELPLAETLSRRVKLVARIIWCLSHNLSVSNKAGLPDFRVSPNRPRLARPSSPLYCLY